MDLSLFQKNILNASSGWAYFLEKNSLHKALLVPIYKAKAVVGQIFLRENQI